MIELTYLVEFDKVSGSGFYTYGVAGEDLGSRKLVYIDSDSTWKLADAETADTMPTLGITMHTIASGKKGDILIQGFIGYSSWAWTVGEALYASENTAGELTHTAPPNPVNLTQQIGFPLTETQIYFDPRQIIMNSEATYTKTVNLPAEALGRGAANNPTVVDINNVTVYSFTVNTDFMTFKFTIPTDYASGGLKLNVVWTNDGGVDDNGKNVKAQFDYQTASEGDAISGSHANSPKTVEDTYSSASGWIEHHSNYVTVAEGDFINEECVYVKVSFVTAPPTVLTCEPHLIGVCLQYTAHL